ncbi:MAG TPA: hypothetical protein VIV60_13695 [Polyangiaceae bacterium]
MRHKRIARIDLVRRDRLSEPRLRQALEKARPEMAALKPPELLVVNVDPIAAAATVRGALPALMALRSQIASDLIRFNLDFLDNLEIYALALIQTHSVCTGIEDKSTDLQCLSAQANSLRARLLGDIQVLIDRGHISAARLTGLRGPNGHRNIASDLLTIAGVLRDEWGSISRMTAVTEDDLTHAESLGDRIFGIIGKRAQQTELSASASRERQRAYTLLMRAYSEVRRAVTYLRWNDGDAARLAPTVYRKTNLGRKKKEEVSSAKSEPVSISDNTASEMSESLTVSVENSDSKSLK